LKVSKKVRPPQHQLDLTVDILSFCSLKGD
jgi:hypothetical protein